MMVVVAVPGKGIGQQVHMVQWGLEHQFHRLLGIGQIQGPGQVEPFPFFHGLLDGLGAGKGQEQLAAGLFHRFPGFAFQFVGGILEDPEDHLVVFQFFFLFPTVPEEFRKQFHRLGHL